MKISCLVPGHGTAWGVSSDRTPDFRALTEDAIRAQIRAHSRRDAQEIARPARDPRTLRNTQEVEVIRRTKFSTGRLVEKLRSPKRMIAVLGITGGVALAVSALPPEAQAASGEGKKPNIVVIMGDDIGIWNIGAYHRGMMAGRTPNLDKLAKEGMLFTDYYAEASCTAGRAAFITGELPIRTGMTTVGQAGAKVGLPAEACTIATALKDLGYATGQFGKNHLGDLNEFLPTVHGFDEFFGYLYHLDAMEDPAHPAYPQELLNKVGPRNMVHSWATDKDDPTVMPRWGKIGKQKIEDAGTLYPKRMETVDDEIRDLSFKFVDKAKADGKPFFLWLNPTRMHIVTHLSDKYEKLRNSKNGWSIQEAGMAQLDDIVGATMQKLKDMGVDDNTIVIFTTDNGTETFTWPDGGNTPFKGQKGTIYEGGFRAPAMIRWPGHVPAGYGRERHHLRPRLVPDLRRRRRQPEHQGRTAEGQEDRRPDLQEPSRQLQPAGHDHRQRAVGPPRDLLLRRKHPRRGAHRRLQVSLHRAARRLARRQGPCRCADSDQPASGPLRAPGLGRKTAR